MINRKLQTRDPKNLENVSNSSMKTVTITFLGEERLKVKKSSQWFELMAQIKVHIFWEGSPFEWVPSQLAGS